MSAVNKWIRIIHRWLSFLFITAILSLIVGTIRMGEEFVSPMWLNILGIGSLLSMALTGLYLLILHYVSKFRRDLRARARTRTSSPAQKA